jgi:hypothetical protein
LARNEDRRFPHEHAKSLIDGSSAIVMKDTPVARKKSVAIVPRRDKYVLGIDRLHTKLA